VTHTRCPLGEEPYARILGRTDDCASTRNGIDPSYLDEKNRNKGDAFWQNRQDGLPDSAVRSFLFLYRVCRCIQSPQRQHPEVLPLRSHFLGRSIPLLRGLNPVAAQPGFVWQEFSRWHRYRSSRQACNCGRICFQPQSYLCSIWLCVAWAILGVPQLDFVGLPRCRHLAGPPASIARRRILEETIRPRIRGVLQSSKKVSLSAPEDACLTPGCRRPGLRCAPAKRLNQSVHCLRQANPMRN